VTDKAFSFLPEKCIGLLLASGGAAFADKSALDAALGKGGETAVSCVKELDEFLFSNDSVDGTVKVKYALGLVRAITLSEDPPEDAYVLIPDEDPES
jgi:hypothetical protein